MTNRETRQFEMLERVRRFGETHTDLFPDSSPGGRAFATVAAVVTQLTGYDDANEKALEQGREAKALTREALLDKLKPVSRTARLIARDVPGFGDRFKLPKSRTSDQAVLKAGRIFADEAESVKAQFLAHGLKDPFIAELRVLVQTFGEAIRERESGKEKQSVAHKGLATALSSGLEAVRALDVLVANELAGNEDVLNAWEHDRKVEAARRPRRTSSVTADLPGTPSPQTAPASAAATAPPAASTASTPVERDRTTDPVKPGETNPTNKAA